MDEQGLSDAAILLMSLGEEEAGQVLRHLSPREVQKIGETIAKTRAVSRERLGEVADRFVTATAGQSLFAADTSDYVRAVMQRALGEEKAAILVDRILQTADLQLDAIRLYEGLGYVPIPSFRGYDVVPGSLCFGKELF